MSGGAPAGDTGIALDAGPSSLTVTFGFGRTFFDRTGLVARRPAGLDPLPAFSADALDPRRSEGDLWVQIGADDALVAFHALRALQKDAGDAARVRWQMNGFNRSAGATAKPMTARNLMGQVDGTGNPKVTDPDFDRRIFVPAGATGAEEWMAAWLVRGGAPDPDAARRLGEAPARPAGEGDRAPEVRRGPADRRYGDHGAGPGQARPGRVDGHPGQRALPDLRPRTERRSGDAAQAVLLPRRHRSGRDAGRRSPLRLLAGGSAEGFVPVQRKLDRGDALSVFIRHEASGLFAVPGGPAEGEYVGQRLLES